MEANCGKLSERILQLTLEIIYLLTGEDNIVAKKTSLEGQNPIMVPLHFLLTVEGNNEQKILEVAQKMIGLLTGEVSPISSPTLESQNKVVNKVEDTNAVKEETVRSDSPYKEEESYPEKATDGSSNLYSRDSSQEGHTIPHQDQREDIKIEVKMEEDPGVMANQPSVKEAEMMVVIRKEESPLDYSADGSSNRNPPERCPRPLDSRDSTQEGHTIPHHDQKEDIKIEVKMEEDPGVRANQPSVKEAEMMVAIRKEESPLDYSAGGPSGWNTSEERLVLPPNHDEGHTSVAQYSPEEGLGANFTLSKLEDMESSADSFIFEDVWNKCRAAIPDVQPSPDDAEVPPIYHNFPDPADPTGDLGTPCSECGKLFRKKRMLRVHMLSHAGKKIYSCPECDSLYLSNYGLVAHRRVHTGEDSFKCGECGQCFNLKSKLTVHMKRHTKPYKCSECHKTFGKKQQLNLHQRIHTGVKPYLCSECGMVFKLKMHLRRHHMVHTGVRPFTCPVCSWSFSIKVNLDYHMRTHTGEKPFPCSLCPKRFGRRRDQEDHESKCQGSGGPSTAE